MTTDTATLEAMTVRDLRTAARQYLRDAGLPPSSAIATATKPELVALMTGDGDALEAPTLPATGGTMEELVRGIVRDELSRHEPENGGGPGVIQIHIPDREPITLTGTEHNALPRLLRRHAAGMRNFWLSGPAGSGKTTLGRQMAERLQLPFGALSLSGGTQEHHLYGRPVPNTEPGGPPWKNIVARFAAMLPEPGVFLLDEADAADPNVLVACNAALADDGFLVNPLNPEAEPIPRHPDNVLIAAANTFGTGPDAMYVGRNALDAATLDRFALNVTFVDYCPNIEGRIMANLDDDTAAALARFVAAVRDAISTHHLRRLCSTRFVVAAVRMLMVGDTMADIRDDFFTTWTADERAKVQTD